MPFYEYNCARCGPFTQLRPVSAFRDACPCPRCDAPSGRDGLSVPALSAMDAGTRRAHAVNERSAHAPRRSGGHGAGCVCCGTAAPRRNQGGAAKSSPGARPWMIGH